MEGSGGVISNGLPGVRGPEGGQVSKLLTKDLGGGPIEDNIQYLKLVHYRHTKQSFK